MTETQTERETHRHRLYVSELQRDIDIERDIEVYDMVSDIKTYQDTEIL